MNITKRMAEQVAAQNAIAKLKDANLTQSERRRLKKIMQVHIGGPRPVHGSFSDSRLGEVWINPGVLVPQPGLPGPRNGSPHPPALIAFGGIGRGRGDNRSNGGSSGNFSCCRTHRSARPTRPS